MSDIKLFSIAADSATELAGSSALLEKDLQKQIESQMEAFLGVRFLASEYSTGKTHKGRIDSLGLDENNCPVIIEYKRHSNENVINQGLFYLDWLLDHQAEFQLLVMKQLDPASSEAIEWAGTRLICIASDFSRYDEHAVQQINRNIELMRYRYFGDQLLLLDLVNSQTADAGSVAPIDNGKNGIPASHKRQSRRSADKTNTERLADAPLDLVNLFDQVCEFALGLGDEVQKKDLKQYMAFKRIKNFLSMVVMPQDPRLLLLLKLDPAEEGEDEGFKRDVTHIGHWGTGNLEVTVRNAADLALALPLIEKSYQAN